MKIFIGEENACNLTYARDLLYYYLSFNQFEMTNNPKEADIIIISDTCSCTAFHMNCTLAYIKEILRNKKEGAITFLTGCITRELTKKISDFDIKGWIDENIDYVIPQNNVKEILKIIDNKKFEQFSKDDFGHYHLLNKQIGEIFVSNGCMNNCSFCKTTFQNYPLKSVDIGEVKYVMDQMDEIGLKEIRIKGTNVSQYGYDLYNDYKLPEIIEYAEKKKNLERLELIGFSFKDAINNDFAQVIRDSRKTTRLSGSLESGSNRILELIRKGFTKEEFLKFSEEIRKKYPKELHLNVITGFPTETNQDILETLEVLEEVDPIKVELCRYTNSSFVDSSKYPQLSPSEIEDHTRIYQKVLSRKNIKNEIVGHGYIYNQ